MNHFACLLAVTTALLVSPSRAQEVREVVGTLNYESVTLETLNDAETIYQRLQLAADDGAIVRLHITFIPKQEQSGEPIDVGYQLSIQPLVNEPEQVICGSEMRGVIDNYRSDFKLQFNHPENMHSPTIIQMGERHDFAFNSLACPAEGYMEKAYSPLVVRGLFTVTTAVIPTADEFRLFPYKP